MSDPIVFEEGGCPVCGDDIMSFKSDEDACFMDGEVCFCDRNCGWHGTISAEDGEAWAQATDDVESLLRVIEDQRVRLIRTRDHLLRIWPRGKECEHQDARQAFIALETKP